MRELPMTDLSCGGIGLKTLARQRTLFARLTAAD
jgi:hypothetical protein